MKKNMNKIIIIISIIVLITLSLLIANNIKEINKSDNYYLNDYNEPKYIKKTSKSQSLQEEYTLDEIKEICENINYKDLSRNPDDYKGKFMHIKGQVVQVVEDNSIAYYRIATKKDSYLNSYFEDIVFVKNDNYQKSNRLLEDDIVDIYGKYDGLYSYTSSMNTTITIPSMILAYYVIK